MITLVAGLVFSAVQQPAVAEGFAGLDRLAALLGHKAEWYRLLVIEHLKWLVAMGLQSAALCQSANLQVCNSAAYAAPSRRPCLPPLAALARLLFNI